MFGGPGTNVMVSGPAAVTGPARPDGGLRVADLTGRTPLEPPQNWGKLGHRSGKLTETTPGHAVPAGHQHLTGTEPNLTGR
jgi:hypothetical protein